ncbi:MAG: UDP-3-O-(3-hydroxymyristoyl)glucosamine N-acyltransferase [Flavobacteriales bacterium]
MQFPNPISLQELCEILNLPFDGDPNMKLKGINEIHKVTSGDISFVDHPKYYDKCLNSAATVIIINKKVDCPLGKGLIFSDDPFSVYNFIVRFYQPFQPVAKSISDTAQIGEGTIIQAGAIVGNHVKIGKDCIIHPNVVIYDHSIIGDRVVIHSGTVIGGDAYYFKRREDGFEKMLSCGRAILEDDVEIGCNCTIDRGVSGDTIIGRGTKFDNQVHIGHDTVVGKYCLFAAQVGVAGVSEIKDNVILWGQVGVSKDLVIGEGAVVLAKSGVSKSLEGRRTYFGAPAVEAREKWKEMAYSRKLPEVMEQVKHLLNK